MSANGTVSAHDGLALDMAHWFDITLVVLGSFLLLFRCVIRIQAIRPGIEVMVVLAMGAALSLFAPLTPWLAGSAYAVQTMLAAGLILGSPLIGRGTAFGFGFLIMVVTLGVAFFSALWHMGLCGAMGDSAGWVHPFLMTVIVLACFFSTKPKCTVHVFEPILCPLLGALFVTLGAAGLAPEGRGLAATGFFAPEPCANFEGTSRDLMMWGAMFLVGALLSQVARRTTDQQKEEMAGSDLGKGFIQNQREGDDEGKPAVLKKGLDDNMSRHNILTEAIWADEGEDQSHLTEHEKGLVNICRNDEFERDRLLWGGGLW